MARETPEDADDLFADTRMSFGDHIEDLRFHLMRAIIGFVIAILVSFSFSYYVLQYIQKPIVKELRAFQAKRQAIYLEKLKAQYAQDPEHFGDANQPTEIELMIRPADWFKLLNLPPPRPPEGVTLEEWRVPISVMMKPIELAIQTKNANFLTDLPRELVAIEVTEVFMVYFKVSLLCGLVLGSPWIFWQIWLFVSAGLYPKEKKLVHVYLPFSLILFLFGVFFCELLVIPQAVHVLLEFNAWLGIDAVMRLEDWLNFALIMPVVFGVSFQTPMLMLILAKIGILDADSFRKKRRIAWFSLAVAAALIMPTQDVPSILMMQVPLVLLYEFGILLAAYGGKQKSEEVEDPEEAVGV
jgi:sec-independent protein translocase protein TatC